MPGDPMHSLSPTFIDALVRRLSATPEITPEPPRPVHVVYGGAHLFTSATPAKLGELARRAMERWGTDDEAFGRTVGAAGPALARAVAARVRNKLATRPVESMCIDFEDGYGPRSSGEEDADAERTAVELAKVPDDGPVIGLRIRALATPTTGRALATLDRFVSTLARARNGAPLRPGFTVTLPKVTRPDEVAALADALDALEAALALETGSIGVELMIEARSALFDASGSLAAPALVEAARGRAVALHLGAYDLTADLGMTAGDQRLDHPYCDLARMVLKLATALPVADGATTVLPVVPKGAPDDAASAAAVHDAWTMHASNVRRAIEVGIWQGWDLHPAQLPARYGALYGHFLSRRDEHAARLRAFVERAMQATRVGQVFEDAATAQGLLNFYLRGLSCGALDEDDLRPTTLTSDELATRSFARIVDSRRARP